MESLYSPSWYRVSELRPRVSERVRFHRHVYRGAVWYVAQNPTDHRVHRLTPAAYALVSMMNGERTAQQIWDLAIDQLGDDAPTQDETLRVFGQLHGADVLRCDIPADTEELFEQLREREEKEARSRRNPISFKVPLLDPDAFLTRFEPWLRPIFSRAGTCIWLAIVGAGVMAALRNAPELASGARGMLEPAGVAAIWFAYPVIKALHELGHAFAVKRWGGEVHDVGVMFLVFVPVPYVEASAASVFPDKHRRMLVAGAGIAVELLIAALCCLAWLSMETGWLKHVAWAGMAIGGISTALFNGNPLLKFDGYYVLADALEIPNLDGRSKQYLGALWKRFGLGLQDHALPETAPGETPWLVGYGIAAGFYRTLITLGIALFLASRFFVLGVALALVAVVLRIALPVGKQIWTVLTDPAVGERRARAFVGSAGVAVLVLLVLFALPVPLRTRGEGVVWLPEQATVRAGAEGFVVELLAEPHTWVEPGTPLVRTRDPGSEASLRELEAERRGMRLRVQSLEESDRVKADIARDQLAGTEARLARAQERAREVVIKSAAAGIFVLPGSDGLVGRYVHQGEVVAHVVDLSEATARVVVRERDVALLRQRTDAAWVRLAHDLGRVLPARIASEVPAASHQLPTPALGTSAGGPFAVDPSDPDGLRTLEPVYELELALPADAHVPAAGERLHARFDHGAEPIGWRAYRSLRRVFLRQLGV